MKKPLLAFVLLLFGCACCLAQRPTPVFKKLTLSTKFYAEGAYYGDFNRDGKLDVVAGPFWFEGPDFTKRHEIPRGQGASIPRGTRTIFSPTWAISTATAGPTCSASAFPATRPIGTRIPAASEGHWKKHLALEGVGNESPMWADINGDGRPELIYNTGGRPGLRHLRPGQARRALGLSPHHAQGELPPVHPRHRLRRHQGRRPHRHPREERLVGAAGQGRRAVDPAPLQVRRGSRADVRLRRGRRRAERRDHRLALPPLRPGLVQAGPQRRRARSPGSST